MAINRCVHFGRGCAAVAFLLAAGIVPATAAGQTPTALAADLVAEAGMSAVDADALWSELNADLASETYSSAFHPAASIGAVPLSLRVLALREPRVPVARYSLRFATRWLRLDAGRGVVPLNVVEVARFNLGPARHRELRRVHGPDAAGDVQRFGVGPHVLWRVVSRPLRGNRAMLLAAGRMELDADEASSARCFGQLCTGLASVIAAAAPWGEMIEAPQPVDRPYPWVEGGVPIPAAAIDVLLGRLDAIERDAPVSSDAPLDWAVEAVIETGLGQDSALEAASRHGGWLDDSVAARWGRMAVMPRGDDAAMVWETKAWECRRGPRFAPPEELCP